MGWLESLESRMIENSIASRLDEKVHVLRREIEPGSNGRQFGGAFWIELIEPHLGNVKSEIVATPIARSAESPCFGDWQAASPFPYCALPFSNA